MDIERLKQRLNGFTSKKDVNNDTYLKINLDTKERLLPPDEKNKTVNLGDRFDTERNRSTYYRIIGTINPTVSNTLFNLNDNINNNAFTWSTFNDIAFLDTSYPKDYDVADNTDYTYPLSLKNNLVEMDGWFGHFNPDKTLAGFCDFYDMEPKRERFSFIPDTAPFHASPSQLVDTTTQVKNWELTITYPASADTQHYMVNSPATTGNGLLIVNKITSTIGTRPMTAFGVACKHNLSIGSVVNIKGTNGFNGQYVVIRTGLDNGDLKDNYFVLDLPNTGTIDGDSRMVKVVNGIESKYYFRRFKKIKTKYATVIETDDYETYGLAFSENIYSDKIIQFAFNEDIDVSNLTDNLDRPLSEIYLSIIKTDSNKLFGKVSSGLETPFIEDFNNNGLGFEYLKGLPIINKIHNGTTAPFNTFTSLESNILISDDLFYGDLVEFNANNLIEEVLGDVHHRFNTLNRELPASLAAVNKLQPPGTLVTETISLGPRQEGYYYKAHHQFKIRNFSSYIETGNATTVDMPTYAIDLGDGRFVWRDLLDLGFAETNIKPLDYPFLNGTHYLYDNFCFYVKRQDPFNMWDLFYTNFPPDPIGEKITDKFTINSEEDVC